MHLQRGRRAHGGEGTFQHRCQRTRFAGAEGEQETMPRFHDGANPHGNTMVRDLIGMIEEIRVIRPGLLGKNLDPSARAERAGWFVEADMAVAAQAEHLQIDAACMLDRFFIGQTFRP